MDRWNTEGVQAHRGSPWPTYRTCSSCSGPNTGLGHNSVVFASSRRSAHVGRAIAAVDSASAQALALTRQAAQDAFNAESCRSLAGSVWNTGGCNGWYLDEHGKNRTPWSGMTWQYWLTTRSLSRRVPVLRDAQTLESAHDTTAVSHPRFDLCVRIGKTQLVVLRRCRHYTRVVF